MPKGNSDTTNPYEVTGPYHYDGGPSYSIRRYGQIVAHVFAPDGDDEMAYRRAMVMAHALHEGETDD